MHPAVALMLSYVSGSIPAAWLAGKWRGVDLRAHGSGNLGATNVLRVLGPGIGAAVFVIDIAKGALPVYFLAPMTGMAGNTLVAVQLLCGVAAILGHARPVFIGFNKGGKGVATSCGVFLAVAPLETALSLLTFAVVVIASGYVSLASLAGAFALPVMLAASFGARSFLFPVGVLTLFFVTFTHRGNIERLRAGRELRFERMAKRGIVPSVLLGLLVIAAAAAWLATRAVA